MEASHYIATVVASLCFLMALGAVPIARLEPAPRSSVAFGAGFLLLGAGMLGFRIIVADDLEPLAILLRNLLLMGGFAGIWSGTFLRCDQRVPVLALALILGAWLVSFIPLLWMQDLLQARFAAAGVAIACGNALAAWCVLTRKPRRNFADYLLVAALLFGVGSELLIAVSALLLDYSPVELLQIYSATAPLSFVGTGIFIYQSYALDAMAVYRHRSETDPLTGLCNRRAFDDRLQSALEAARRFRRPLSLVIADLDHFKRVNDRHGHATGDVVLQAFAARLRVDTRAIDVIARIGGEEFAIIMTECAAEQAAQYAERIRLGVRAHVAAGGEMQTASFGIAEAIATDTPEALVARADSALYAAKAAGRDRVSRIGAATDAPAQAR